ncbi:endonuclease [Xylanimonas oleitrophica]|uniref:Endonuclease n=1 Tax=Xylanimonas oleitrophica TaxID=2607479 RepID=A0A2W5WQG4_9MICO|nr:endonuclease/exonuclease/phosphatase family protein [Xylanimonas oleitrophica]PZR53192.1 endonuclease [Xylanimonas oleitrophica]
MTRLVTFNVQHGRSQHDGRVDPARLADAVVGLGGDVVALQEVDRWQPRSLGSDLAHAVVEATGVVEHRYLPALAGLVSGPGAAPRRARGDEPPHVPAYGIALLSRHPVREWWRVRLPVATPWLGPVHLGPDEPRVALAAVVETPDGPLTVVATHLSSWRRWNRVQLRWLARHLRAAPRPLVLLGDLNVPAPEPARITGWRPLVHVPTFPRHRPRTTIDHVLADGDVEATGPARAVDTGVSDHRAVVVDVAVGGGLHP